MSYQSLTFIAFCGVVLLFYYTIGRKRQTWVLAAANLAFYAISGVKYIPFLAVTMIATYTCGRAIGKIYENSDKQLAECTELPKKKEIRAAAKKKAKRALIISLIISVALLAVCKYTTFTLKNINGILSLFTETQVPMFKMILPLGISFYTFMALSYVLDIYWKRYKAEKNFLLYAVYLSYFPHVVQGPIDRFNEFKEQIKDGVAFKYENLTYGAQLAIWGFFKKLVIADRLGLYVDEVIENWKNYDGVFIIFAIVIYSIQIYADFSGCIDIVTGVSEMLGIKLRANFNHPYFSRTMGEFWRRWHISLQEWFKDYIYYPVSVSGFTKKIRKKLKAKDKKRAEALFASCFPVLVVWLITGIWHGAAWKFVIWGLFHAALLIGSAVFEPTFLKLNEKLHVDTENFGWHFFQMLRTFFLCCVGRIFFRADGLHQALSLIKKMLLHTNPSILFGFDYSVFGISGGDVVLAIVSMAVLLIVDMLQEKMEIRQTLSKQNIIFRWIIIFAGLFAVIIFGIYGPGYDASSFIYEQF